MERLPAAVGPYRVVRQLGAGGMGTVYEAIQEPIGRRVALKVLLPEYAYNREIVTRCFNEARAVNVIEHPSLVQVSDYRHASDGSAYLVMEFLRGETSETRLARLQSDAKRLPLAETLQLAAQIADALAAAHDKGIIHRDLKPAKVTSVEKAHRPVCKSTLIMRTNLPASHRRSLKEQEPWVPQSYIRRPW